MKAQDVKSSLVMGLLATLALSSCGVRNSNTLDQASQDVSDEPVVPASADKTLAMCSVDAGDIYTLQKYSDFEVKLTAARSAFGAIDGSKVKLHFSKLSSLFQTEGWEIRIYRGRVSPTNDVTLDPTPVGFNFEARSSLFPITIPTAGTEYIIAGCTVTASNNCRDRIKDFGYQRLTWAQAQTMEAFAKTKSINTVRSTNVSTFIDTVSLDLRLSTVADYSIKFLRVVATKDGEKVREVEVLVPQFYSNPETYEIERPSYLTRLHPNKEQKNKGWSANDFLNFTRSHCLY